MNSKARGPPGPRFTGTERTRRRVSCIGNGRSFTADAITKRGENLIIELIRAHVPEDVGQDEECGICGERFRSEVVLAQLLAEGRTDMGLACRSCIALMGRYKPEKFPTIEEYEAALRRFLAPIWGSVEEASRAWEEGEPHQAALDASRVEPEDRGRDQGLSTTLGRINADLTAACERLEDVPLEAFAEEDDYWRARRSISKAGGIVAGEQGRLRRQQEEPAE